MPPGGAHEAITADCPEAVTLNVIVVDDGSTKAGSDRVRSRRGEADSSDRPIASPGPASRTGAARDGSPSSTGDFIYPTSSFASDGRPPIGSGECGLVRVRSPFAAGQRVGGDSIEAAPSVWLLSCLRLDSSRARMSSSRSAALTLGVRSLRDWDLLIPTRRCFRRRCLSDRLYGYG